MLHCEWKSPSFINKYSNPAGWCHICENQDHDSRIKWILESGASVEDRMLPNRRNKNMVHDGCSWVGGWVGVVGIQI
jgi:hypothetical protein